MYNKIFIVLGCCLIILGIVGITKASLMPIKAIIICVKALRFQFFKLLAIYGILSMGLLLSVFPILLLLDTGLEIIDGEKYLVDSNNYVYSHNIDNPVFLGVIMNNKIKFINK